ncbi:MAG TPA: HD domain-containing protein [Treponemataceae bacterium]|jgi:putative hydrolase of HD superfamily|nr:MAG: HD domain-containing protein [Treponema sp.]HOC28739.1 HD domain-containing protein [Treponemataceae bacterium]HPX47438.1 HD domain-containing protein [Treponemataceae bacterium]HQL33175.1 HD domain-containing protein [Treponemataceae bacterium]
MEKIDFAQNSRLEKQLAFLIEIDKVKNIYRKSKLFDGSRFENDAEHSWTIAIMAVLLNEFSNFKIDLEKVVLMLLIHDIVEIDAGDTFLYAAERADAAQKEEKAAERIFGMLDADQRDRFISLWKEFEDKKTNEAKFAGVFDRLEPLLQNYLTEGSTWKANGITYEMVYEKNRLIKEGSEEIWTFVDTLLHKAVEKGYLKK